MDPLAKLKLSNAIHALDGLTREEAHQLYMLGVLDGACIAASFGAEDLKRTREAMLEALPKNAPARKVATAVVEALSPGRSS